MNQPLRIGFIGCGHVTATLHLPALHALADVVVTGLVDPDPARLRAVGDRYGIVNRWATPEPLWADPAVDIVAVCTPPRSHVPLALAALAAGKHVFVEKPLALELADAARLVAAARRATPQTTVGFNLRHHRLVVAARALLDRGALGPIEFIRSVSSSSFRPPHEFPDWLRHRTEGGGVLSEYAVHHFDLWRFLVGAEFEELTATSRSDDHDDVTAAVTARLSNGAIASGVFSQCAAEENRLEIFGRAGRLAISFYRFDGLEFVPRATFPGDLRSRVRALWQNARQAPQAVTAARHGGEFCLSYVNQWQQFGDGIRQSRPPTCTVEDGYRALQAVVASIESSRTGRPVSSLLGRAGG